VGHGIYDFTDDFITAVEKNLDSQLAASVGWIPLYRGYLLGGW
jgi:hypothetical protein